jgi:hypothetical protein
MATRLLAVALLAVGVMAARALSDVSTWHEMPSREMRVGL